MLQLDPASCHGDHLMAQDFRPELLRSMMMRSLLSSRILPWLGVSRSDGEGMITDLHEAQIALKFPQ